MSKTKSRARWQPAAGTHMTPAMAREMLAEFDGSGLSSAAFSRRHGLANQRVSYWRSRLRDLGLDGPSSRKASAVSANKFAELVTKADSGGVALTQTLEATLAGGSRVVVHGSWDAASMRTWLAAIEGRRC